MDETIPFDARHAWEVQSEAEGEQGSGMDFRDDAFEFEPRSVQTSRWTRASTYLQALGENVFKVDFLSRLNHVHMKGLAIVTDYSGAGSPELAAANIDRALRKHRAQCAMHTPAPLVRCLRACEVLPGAREVLRGHGIFAAECVFTDMHHRQPMSLHRKVSAIMNKFNQKARGQVWQGCDRHQVIQTNGQKAFARS